QARQVCSATGQVTLWVIEAGRASYPPAVAQQVRDRLTTTPFDYQHEFPVRMAAIMADGRVSQLVIAYLHLAVDAGGLSALQADVLARHPVTGAPAGPVRAVQPLELAAKQASPAGQRQSAASLRHLERVLRTAEPALFGQPREAPAEYQAFRYRSPATALALARIVQAQRVPAPSALLALFAMSLVAELGVDPVWIMVLVNNRFRPGLADSVSQLVQASPFVLELGAGCTFAEALARAQQGLLQTYKHAYYDGSRRDALVERIERERGCPIQLGCFFNDRQDERAPNLLTEPASDDKLRQALARSSWQDESGPLPDVGLFVNVDHLPDALEFPVSFDTRYLDRDAVLRIVRGIETLAVRAAVAPDGPALA
ncbi:MAG TPA: condensation domain-containing protein, partial [Jatrophihabitans sp.]|nr:condensation domain-containing protein [Jatrophihabitans sp.]